MPRWRRSSDSDGAPHLAVANAADYEVITTLWRRTVGNGYIECRLVRAKRPAKRLVQLYGEWTDAGVLTSAVVGVDDELDEARQVAQLERRILADSRRPTAAA